MWGLGGAPGGQGGRREGGREEGVEGQQGEQHQQEDEGKGQEAQHELWPQGGRGELLPGSRTGGR